MSDTRSPISVAGGDEPANEAQDNDGVQPSMTMHRITYSGMPVHMYPFQSGVMSQNPLRAKRRQVKNACTNCAKACKKCDEARPCLRCVRYGVSEECVDSKRKERKKGIKRGPYKKRDGKSTSSEPVDAPPPPVQPAVALPMGMPPGSSTGVPMMAPMSYAPGFYPQMQPVLAPTKAGEAPAYYQPIYFMPPPAAPPHPGQDGENVVYPAQPSQFYPATFLPYAQPYPTAYMVTHPGARPDGQMPMQATHFAYPQFYPKPPAAGPSHADVDGSRRDLRDD